MSAIGFSPSFALPPSARTLGNGTATAGPIHIGKPMAPDASSARLLPYQRPLQPQGIIGNYTPWPNPPIPMPPCDFPKIDIPQWPPIGFPRPPCGCQPDDTQEYRLGCFGPQAINLDSGRNGPDNINVVIHEDGSSTVTINGCEYNYTADETSRLSIGVDGNDNYNVQDKRSALDKMLNPTPVKIYTPER